MVGGAAVQCVGAFAGAPPPEAFHVETVVDPFTLQNVVGMVRHVAHPFVVSSVGWTASYEDQCRLIGLAYLDALQAALPAGTPALIHPDIHAALTEARAGADYRFGWLPVTWPGNDRATHPRPVGSFWATRSDAGDPDSHPQLLVLMAGAVDTVHQLQAGSDMGLRIVLHVHESEVRIHGITLAGLTDRRALEATPMLGSEEHDIFDLVRKARAVIGTALDCENKVWITNLENACRTGAPDHLIAIGYALRFPKLNEIEPAEGKSPGRSYARAKTYDFRVELKRQPSGDLAFVQIHRDNYIGAGATLSCFVQDAASNDRQDLPQRTLDQPHCTGSEEALGLFRDPIDAALADADALKYIDEAAVDCFETLAASERSAERLGGRTVTQSDGVAVASDMVVVTGAGDTASPPVRSDQQGVHDAFLRSAELFERMKTYGLDAPSYFRFARLPLVHRVRPAMRWAPDGELPSAEVRPFLIDPKAWAGEQKEKRPSDTLQLLLNFGSADPWHRYKLPLVPETAGGTAPGQRVKAQYLSVASDPRWAWHEFGHVLNFASTGELEFPFAHSAGDALAAIACDPISRLARADDPDSTLRHVTYPWIQVPGRSHGRSATGGYGWCGCRNLTRLDFTATLDRYHHSYFGEQLMSSSLFRLYRSLGGDTRGDAPSNGDPDEGVRLSASDYCIYLIMRGISLLGPDTLAPARTPDQFVSALIDADLGTGDWTLIDANWPFNRDTRGRVQRRGGRVHKVIRWAFEQQGLYATDDPRCVSDCLGQPPAVDLFIADRRGPGGTAGDGGYAPVPLRSGTAQPWQAHRRSLSRQGASLTVAIGNRGSKVTSASAKLRAWVRPSENAAWRAITLPRRALQAPNPGAEADVRIRLPDDLAAQSLWVLVSVDTPADPSNLRQGDAPPRSPEALLELVAHDNNLALAWL